MPKHELNSKHNSSGVQAFIITGVVKLNKYLINKLSSTSAADTTSKVLTT